MELGFYVAVALLLSYVESLVPLSFGIPGMKLGLPNLVVVLLLYEKNDTGEAEGQKVSRQAVWDCILVNGCRIILSGFLFGNLYGILYALAGAAVSFLAMLAGRKTHLFSVIGVSVLGGVFHNIGQIIVAMLVVETYAVGYYMPALIFAGTITGGVLGLLAMELIPYLERHRR